MMSRRMKAAFYFGFAPLMRLNGMLYKQFRAPPRGGGEVFKVHLGPGQNNYIDGWVNVDANKFTGKCDVWADLRNPLPFHDDSVDAFYSHHVIEHLPNIVFHLQEVFRCLKPGGVYRVAGPNGDSAIAKFIEGDKSWFSDFPDKRESIGGRLENFIFCRGEHLTLLTFSMLHEFMEKVGFINIKSCKPEVETGFEDIFMECLAKEEEQDYDAPHTLVIEAQKP